MYQGRERFKVICQTCLHPIYCAYPPSHCPKCKTKFNRFTVLEMAPKKFD